MLPCTGVSIYLTFTFTKCNEVEHWALLFCSSSLSFRYLAIFFPQTTKMTPKTACLVICVIWAFPLCAFVPWIVVYRQKTFDVSGFDFVACTADWSKNKDYRKIYTLGVVFLTCYLMPLIFIAIFYVLIAVRVWKRNVRGMRGTRAQINIHRAKIRIVRMLVAVFVTFALSWLPLYSIELRTLFGPPPQPAEKTLLRTYLVPLAQWLGASNSCVNPFIYCYFSDNFRRSIVAVVHSRSCCVKIAT